MENKSIGLMTGSLLNTPVIVPLIRDQSFKYVYKKRKSVSDMTFILRQYD